MPTLEYDDEIKIIANKFGSKLSFLGEGREGRVWSIDNNYAIKIYSYPKNYWEQPIPRLEARVYEFGFLRDNRFWVVKEMMDVINPEDFEQLDLVIYEVAHIVEKTIREQPEGDRRISRVKSLSKKAFKEFKRNSELDQNDINKIKDLYQLPSNWLYQLTVEMTYKSLTNRDLDFRVENLGIRRTDRKLIFFDW